jgi:hypothetical protein
VLSFFAGKFVTSVWTAHATGVWKANYCSLMTTLSATDLAKLCNNEVSIRGAVPPHSSLSWLLLYRKNGLGIAVVCVCVCGLRNVQSSDYVVVLSFLHRWQLGVRNAI